MTNRDGGADFSSEGWTSVQSEWTALKYNGTSADAVGMNYRPALTAATLYAALHVVIAVQFITGGIKL